MIIALVIAVASTVNRTARDVAAWQQAPTAGHVTTGAPLLKLSATSRSWNTPSAHTPAHLFTARLIT